MVKMEKIRKDLDTIKEAINSSDELKSDSVATELLHNINSAIENPGAFDFGSNRTLVEALEERAKKFEVSHPKLIEDLRIIINSLNDIGI
jgi:hypothetical protein